MPIEVQCSCCASTIRVRDELAGRTGSCKRCGSSITIPRPENLHPTKLLGDSTPDEMMSELRRRGRRAVLLLLDGDQPNAMGGDQVSQQPTQLQALGADAFDQGQLADLFRHLAEAAGQRHEVKKTEQAEAAGDVFSLKGDSLGMSLADFKQKHLRRIPGSDRIAPFCSDEYPGQRIDDLLAEAWHVGAGIVHARTDLPEENNPPTIAGVKSELVLYQFVDGKLFQVSAFFGPEAFHQLKGALTTKFGSPVDGEGTDRSVHWWTMASTIDLEPGSLRPPAPTRLTYRHDELTKEAGKRKPDVTADL